jgi:carboxymethylenebutenolidase
MERSSASLGPVEASIPTPEGTARSFVFTPPQGSGPWPAVILLMDAAAIRPALFEMAQRLASHGYYVLLPDMFWRLGPYEPLVLSRFADNIPGLLETFGRLMRSTSAEKANRDIGAFLGWLAGRPQADSRKVGISGYCMGGGMALRAAATFPDRIVAAAAFHPANLATEADDSPHRLAHQIKARVLVGGADQDTMFDEGQRERLAGALDAAGVQSEVVIYPGALHGFVPTDTRAHHPQGAERHWRELLALLDATLQAET